METFTAQSSTEGALIKGCCHSLQSHKILWLRPNHLRMLRYQLNLQLAVYSGSVLAKHLKRR